MNTFSYYGKTKHFKKQSWKVATHLHLLNEACDVGCGPARIGDSCEVVEVSGSTVPVHHQDVQVFLPGQQVHNVVDPDRRSPCGPVAMDDEGRGSGQVEERLGRKTVVGEFLATLQVGTCVEQQPYVQVGPDKRLVEVQVSEVVTFALLPWN